MLVQIFSLFGIALSFIVFVSSYNKAGRYFSLYMLAFSSWALASTTIGSIPAPYKDLGISLVFTFAMVMNYSFVCFLINYYKVNLFNFEKGSLFLVFPCLLSYYIPQTIRLIRFDPSTNIVIIEFSLLIALTFLYVLLAALTSFYVQRKGWRAGLVSRRIRIFIILSTLTLFATPIVNGVLANLLDSINIAESSLVYQFVIVSLTSYFVFDNSFLRINIKVLRTLLYVLCLGVIGYGAMGVITKLVGTPALWNSYLAFGMGIILWSSKKYFDKFTDNLFFQNSYDVKDALDKLADRITNQDDLQVLLEDSLSVYSKYIKTSFSVAYAISKGKVVASASLGSKKYDISIEALLADLELGASASKFEQVLSVGSSSQHNNSCYAYISTTEREGLINGVYVFSDKENGTNFTARDIELMKISSKNLAVAIENAIRFKKIENFNEQLQEEVRVATKKLRETNEKLVSLDKTKDEFMSIASHQLRTPLTTVKNLTLLLRDGMFGDINSKQKDALQSSYVSIDRMVSLVGDFLDATRISSGKFVLNKSEADFSAIVKEAVVQSRQNAKEKKLKFNTSIPSKKLILNLDSEKVREVLLNYIDNAIQYTPEGKTVDLSMTISSETVRVIVKDEGIGVPDSDKPGLFSKSFRASNARAYRPDGTGLGLFLAKKIIDLHGGETIFKSKENKGSTFGFTLPLRA